MSRSGYTEDRDDDHAPGGVMMEMAFKFDSEDWENSLEERPK